jgi:hypothetical protein
MNTPLASHNLEAKVVIILNVEAVEQTVHIDYPDSDALNTEFTVYFIPNISYGDCGLVKYNFIGQD